MNYKEPAEQDVPAETAWMRFVGKYFNHTAALLMAALWICTETSADDKWKYLAVTDPVPIRFLEAGPQYDPGSVLPPLEMGDEPPAETADTTPKPVESDATKEPEVRAEQLNTPQPKAPE